MVGSEKRPSGRFTSSIGRSDPGLLVSHPQIQGAGRGRNQARDCSGITCWFSPSVCRTGLQVVRMKLLSYRWQSNSTSVAHHSAEGMPAMKTVNLATSPVCRTAR